eukprot:12738_1
MNMKLTFILYFTLQTASKTIFVSNVGHDHIECAAGITACGTLYYASMMATQNLSDYGFVDIQINQGQNETDISNYFNNFNLNQSIYHPCLPITFQDIGYLKITFNVSKHRDWFPTICSSLDHNFINKYFFDAINVGNFSIYGLNINFYDLQIGLIHSDNPTTCYYCIFENIYSSISYPMIESFFLLLFSNQFRNITLTNHLIYVHIGHNYVGIDNTNFTQISTETSLILYDSDHELTIQNTNFMEMNGSIFVTEKRIYLSLRNIFISTAQLYSENKNGLFNFQQGDITMRNIDFSYSYDLAANCYIYDNSTYNYNYKWITYLDIVCSANTPFIINYYSSVHLDNVYFTSSGVTTELYDQYKQYAYADIIFMHYDEDEDEDEESFVIENYRDMCITNSFVDGYVVGAQTFILNKDQLIIDNFEMISATNFNPNVLQSQFIITTPEDSYAELLQINNSILLGSSKQLLVWWASVHIANTKFENATLAHEFRYNSDVLIENCSYYRLGSYYGPFIRYHQNAAIWAEFAKKIVIKNNLFECWDPDGFIYLLGTNNVSITKNIFNVNYDDMVYDIPSDWLEHTPDRGLVTLRSCTTQLTQNEFKSNDIDPFNTPCIWYNDNYFWSKSSEHCLYGNKFINFALKVQNANITSCFRHNVINCLYDGDYCLDGMYGVMKDESLLNTASIFNVNIDVDIIQISSNNSFVVLDNVDVIVLANYNIESYSLLVDIGNILFLDSILSNIQILYNESKCNVIYNDRLRNDVDYVSKLLISCNIDEIRNDTNTVNVMNASITTSVDHFSITKLIFFAKSDTYFPGQSVDFDYFITDKFGNNISDNAMFYNFTYLSSTTLVIAMENNHELGLSVEFAVDQFGACSVCNNGIRIPAINLQKDLGTTFHLSLSLQHSVLFLSNKFLSLNVIGCGVGYGASSNGYICDVCDFGTFNLKPNNTETCNICPANNREIVCIDQTIYFEYNSWIGFDNNDNIISSTCQPFTCCQNEQCDYLMYMYDEQVFCAKNRNFSVYLCGVCDEGYSESVNSAECVKCNKNNLWQWISLTIFLSLLFAIFMLISKSQRINYNKQNQKELTMCRCLEERKIVKLFKNNYFKQMVQIMIFRNICYYEQGISMILQTNIRDINVSTINAFSSLFNFHLNLSSNGSSIWCFIDGLTAKQKVLTQLIGIGFVTGFLLIFYAFTKCRCCPEIWCKKRKISFNRTFFQLFLLCIGGIFGVLFKLLNCHPISNEIVVHFYFPEE